MYPSANINAAKINQITLFEKLDNAQFILSVGFPIIPKIATTEIPTNPTSAAGTGSIIRPTTTAKNIAKKCQALALRPSGAGINQNIAKTVTGIIILIV